MRGTRYGDFSRFVRGDRDDTAVLMQQGRVQLDSDFNAQAELIGGRLRTAVADLVGRSGAPMSDPGFEVRPRNALALGGDGAAVVHDAPPLRADRCDELTIELWPSWAGCAGTIFDWDGREEGAHGRLRIAVDDEGRLNVWMSEDGEEVLVLGSLQALPQDRFVHVALVGSERAFRLFVDGTCVAEGPRTGPAVGAGVLVMGGPVKGEHPCFRGLLRGVRAWSRARWPDDEDDVLDDPGLIAWWPLDDDHGHFAVELVAGRRARLEGDPPPGWRLVGFEVEPGRYYVDGIACTLEDRLSYTDQPTLPFPPLPSAPGTYLVFLEVWEETIAWVQDRDLADVALGGLDTTVRARTAFAVRTLRLSDDADAQTARAVETLEAVLASQRRTGLLAARHIGEDPLGNYLYRVEVHSGGAAGGAPGQAIGVSAVYSARKQVELAEPWPSLLPAGSEVEIAGYRHHEDTLQRHLYVVARALDEGRCMHLTTEPRDLEGLRDLTVRIAPPTFKWSRRNGAEIVPIRPVAPGARNVQPWGTGEGPSAIGVGDVVEVLDDRVGLDGPAPPLARVTDVSKADGSLTLSEAVGEGIGLHSRSHPFLRRWDQPAHLGQGPDCAIPIETDEWFALEHGLEVTFSPGTYRRGDYWWIVARQHDTDVRWPHGPDGPQAVEPEGVERRRAPLALAILGEDDVELVDLRSWIVPATRAARNWPGAEATKDDINSDDLIGPASVPRESAAPPEPPISAEVPTTEAPSTTDAPTSTDGPPTQDAPAPPSPPAPLDSPILPDGFAIVGPVDAEASGFVSTEIEVVTRGRWQGRRLELALGDIESVALLQGQLVIATRDSLWRADPDTGSVERLAELPDSRADFACRAWDRRLLLVGGRPADGPADGAILVFDPDAAQWGHLTPMPLPVAAPAVALDGDRLHVLGGSTRHRLGRLRVYTDHQVLDLGGGVWSTASELPGGRSAGRATSRGGRIHLVGGYGPGASELVREHIAYDTQLDRWMPLETFPAPRAVDALAASRCELLAVTRHEYGACQIYSYGTDFGGWERRDPPPGLLQAAGLSADGARFILVGLDGQGGLAVATLSGRERWALFTTE